MGQTTRAHDAQVIVIGGGVIGAACAFRLAQAGREVLLLNADGPEVAASYGNAGHIATEQLFPLASKEVLRNSWRYLLDADSPLRVRAGYLLPLMPWLARFAWAARESAYTRGVAALMALQHSALADMTDLLADAGIGNLLHRNGHLEVFETQAGCQAAQGQANRLLGYGVESVHLSASAVRAQVPQLNTEVRGAVQYLGRALRFVADSQQGASLVLEDGRQLHADQVLVCAGAWSKPLAASLGYRVPLDTERGYHICVNGLPVGQGTRHQALLRPVASNERKVIMTSMSVGLRMTGTVEFGGLKLAPDPLRFALLRQHLQALLPGIETADMRTWMGFRPSLPDHLPVLGTAPNHQQVFFAFGHQHLGLTLAGVSAAVTNPTRVLRMESCE